MARHVHDFDLKQSFVALHRQLTEAYGGTSFRSKASSRTASNREQLVADFLRWVLPVSVQTRIGAIVIDSFGGVSRDVDVVLLNPWAAPVWPHAHGVVPVEGVLVAVFVERKWSARLVWEQVASVKELVKWLVRTEGYAIKARRTYRSEAGVWWWEGGPNSGSVRKDAIVVVETILSRREVFRKALAASCSRARKRRWSEPSDHHDSMTQDYVKYLSDVGAMAPNWIYFHNRKLLLVKFQARGECLPRSVSDLNVVSPNVATIVIPRRSLNGRWGERVDAIVGDEQFPDIESRRWGYVVYHGDECLQTLALHLDFAFDLYGKERTNYAAYLHQTNQNAERTIV